MMNFCIWPVMSQPAEASRDACQCSYALVMRLTACSVQEMYLSDDGETTLGTLQARYSERTIFPGAKRGSKRRHGKVNGQ